MKVSEIKRIGVFGGGGIIGSSWATYFLWKGFPVSVYDLDQKALTLSRERITRNLSYITEKGILTQEAVVKALGRALFTQDIKEACHDVQFVQECGPENYDIKKSMVAALDQHGSPEALFASSTSGLLIEIVYRNREAFPQKIRRPTRSNDSTAAKNPYPFYFRYFHRHPLYRRPH